MRVCVCVLQGHGEADRRLSPGVGGRGRSPLISTLFQWDILADHPSIPWSALVFHHHPTTSQDVVFPEAPPMGFTSAALQSYFV